MPPSFGAFTTRSVAQDANKSSSFLRGLGRDLASAAVDIGKDTLSEVINRKLSKRFGPRADPQQGTPQRTPPSPPILAEEKRRNNPRSDNRAQADPINLQTLFSGGGAVLLLLAFLLLRGR